MRSILSFSIVLYIVLLFSCNTDKSYTITGSVPKSNFNGEYVYMIPMDKYSIGRVDSALIADSSFVFKGKADSAEIYILRAQKPLLRFDLQDILVVREAGKIHAKFEERSSVGGTALNDSLQRWKENKENSDDHYFELSNKISKADSLGKILLSVKADSLKKANIDFHFNFAWNNRDNIVGKLVKRIMGTSFTQEQKKELGIN